MVREALLPQLHQTVAYAEDKKGDVDSESKDDSVADEKPSASKGKPKSKSDDNASTTLGGDSIYGEARVPQIEGKRLVLPVLVVPTTQLAEIGNGQTPEDSAAEAMTDIIPLPESFERSGYWMRSSYQWQAANTFSHPLYFEDIMLERHGQECKHCLQPAMSAVRFFTTLPALPYKMTVQRPCESYHTLGYYRPGSPAPKLLQRPPFQRDAAINQAAWLTGAILVFP